NQAKFDEIFRLNFGEQLADAFLCLGMYGCRETNTRPLSAITDDFLKTIEGAADNEQDVRRINLHEVLVRMLAATLRRHGGNRTLNQLQQGLLHALARHVAGDGRVVRFTRNLVDFVNVDNGALRFLYVVVATLQQLLNNV